MARLSYQQVRAMPDCTAKPDQKLCEDRNGVRFGEGLKETDNISAEPFVDFWPRLKVHLPVGLIFGEGDGGLLGRESSSSEVGFKLA